MEKEVIIDKWTIDYDQKSKLKSIFVNGHKEFPESIQLPSGVDFFETKLKTIKIIWSKNTSKILDYLSKCDKKDEVLICFGGSDNDFKALIGQNEKIPQRDFVQLRKGCSHVINICWDHNVQLWSYCDVISSVVPPEVKSKPTPKPTVKKDAPVDVQKSGNAKKTNK